MALRTCTLFRHLAPLLLLLPSLSFSADELRHFKFTAMTGNNMTVVILKSIKPTVGGAPLAAGDEIGAFTPAGVCVGATRWDGVHNTYITVWGNDGRNPIVNGIKTGETMSYRIWSAARNTEFPAAVAYVPPPAGHATASSTYVIDGIAFLSRLAGMSQPIEPPLRLLLPADTATVTAVACTFVWTRGDRGIDRYALQIAEDSLMSNIIFADAVTDTTLRRTGLKSGVTYWWRVRAHGAAGWQNGSDVRTFTVAY